MGARDATNDDGAVEFDAEQRRSGARARSGEFRRYDQVEKRQDYHLAEQRTTGDGRELPGDLFDPTFEIRTCDLGRCLRGDAADRRTFTDELGGALEEIGFAVLHGHGLDPLLFEHAAAAVERTFTAHGPAAKRQFLARRHGAVNQGYFPLEETSGIHPDLVEGWVFGRRAFDLGQPGWRAADFWPDPEAEPALRALCRAQLPLVLPIMRSVLRYLGCDETLFDARLREPSFALRLNYYPPLTDEQVAGGAGRLLGHEDTDLFTLLPAPQSEGLQVLDRRSFRWVRLTPPTGTLVINTGDYMQRITNDRLPSTTHRVAVPRDPAERRRARISFPMNVYLHEDELLEVLPGLGPPRYPPVRALEFHTRTTAKYYGDDYAVIDGQDGEPS